MKISDLLRMCLRSLVRRKVRTLLTVTGVIIGTCSIVVMISLGVGLNKTNEEQMAQYMDLTSITVYTQETNAGSASGKSAALNDQSLKSMENMDHVVAVTPVRQFYGNFMIKTNGYSYTGEIIAMDLSKMEQFGYKTAEGRLAQVGEDQAAVLFGAEAAWEFMNAASGEYADYTTDEEGNYLYPPLVDAMADRFTIAAIGESNANGGNDMMVESYSESYSYEEPKTGQEHDIQVLGVLELDYSRDGSVWGICISLELAEQLMREYNELNGIANATTAYDAARIKVDQMDNVSTVEELLQADGFATYSATEFREAMREQARIIQLVLGGLGAIAMLVAALGITNTMIMSIYERTREIGVMKVLGCRLRDIRTMFLMEAGGIGFLGGVLGILISYGISILLNLILNTQIDLGVEGSVQMSYIPLWLVLLGMGFAVGVGLVAGFYPANRAVRISALSAIRQE